MSVMAPLTPVARPRLVMYASGTPASGGQTLQTNVFRSPPTTPDGKQPLEASYFTPHTRTPSVVTTAPGSASISISTVGSVSVPISVATTPVDSKRSTLPYEGLFESRWAQYVQTGKVLNATPPASLSGTLLSKASDTSTPTASRVSLASSMLSSHAASVVAPSKPRNVTSAHVVTRVISRESNASTNASFVSEARQSTGPPSSWVSRQPSKESTNASFLSESRQSNGPPSGRTLVTIQSGQQLEQILQQGEVLYNPSLQANVESQMRSREYGDEMIQGATFRTKQDWGSSDRSAGRLKLGRPKSPQKRRGSKSPSKEKASILASKDELRAGSPQHIPELKHSSGTGLRHEVLNDWISSLGEPGAARGEGFSSHSSQIASSVLEDLEFHIKALREESNARSPSKPRRSSSVQRRSSAPEKTVKRSFSAGHRLEAKETARVLFGPLELTNAHAGDTGARFRHLQEFVDSNGSHQIFLKDDAKRQNMYDIAKSPRRSVRVGCPHVQKGKVSGGATEFFIRSSEDRSCSPMSLFSGQESPQSMTSRRGRRSVSPRDVNLRESSGTPQPKRGNSRTGTPRCGTPHGTPRQRFRLSW